eukprot:2885052-Pyramimonas_sp.AAC.1
MHQPVPLPADLLVLAGVRVLPRTPAQVAAVFALHAAVDIGEPLRGVEVVLFPAAAEMGRHVLLREVPPVVPAARPSRAAVGQKSLRGPNEDAGRHDRRAPANFNNFKSDAVKYTRAHAPPLCPKVEGSAPLGT